MTFEKAHGARFDYTFASNRKINRYTFGHNKNNFSTDDNTIKYCATLIIPHKYTHTYFFCMLDKIYNTILYTHAHTL